MKRHIYIGSYANKGLCMTLTVFKNVTRVTLNRLTVAESGKVRRWVLLNCPSYVNSNFVFPNNFNFYFKEEKDAVLVELWWA
jgi:hypothetical protein